MGLIDPEQLSGWFDTYGPPLLLYARQFLDQESAEEQVQEAFVRLMACRHRPDHPKAWLFRTVRNGSLSQLRSRHRQQKYRERLAAEQNSIWFDRRADDLIDAATAQAAMQSLPEAQREVVVLRIWADLTFQEVADLTGEPVSTVFSRYQTALETIRKIMESPCQTKID